MTRHQGNAKMKASARERLISSTIDLMSRRGVAATRVADLLEHSGVARRSVYLNFPEGKSELITEATRTAGHNIGATLAAPAGGDTRATVTALLEFFKDTLRSSRYALGCPIAAATLARAEVPTAADAAAEAFASWQDIIANRLCADGVDTHTAQALATTIIAAIEGALLLCIAARSTQPLDQTTQMIEALITQHIDQH